MSELGNDGTGKSAAGPRRPRRKKHRGPSVRRVALSGHYRTVRNWLGDGGYRVSRRKRSDQVGKQPTPDRYFYDLAGHRIRTEGPWPRWFKQSDLARLEPELEWNIYLNYVATTPLRRRLEIIEMENHR